MRFLSTLVASVLGSLIAFGVFVLFGLLFLFALAAAGDQQASVGPASVVVADLTGSFPEMVSGDPIAQAFGGEPAADVHDLKRGLQMAASDDRIEAVWLRLGMLTASWASMEEIRRGILAVRAVGKPVYATSSSYFVTEKELFLASAADSIWLNPESIVEFNGFHLSVLFYDRLMERAGVEPQVVRAGRFKSAVEPYLRSDMSDANRLQLQALADGIDRHFIEAVAQDRGLAPEALRALTQAGSVMNARDAVEAGLADRTGFIDETRASLKRFIGSDDTDDDLETISLRDYARTPASAAGLKEGREGEIAVVYALGTILAGKSNETPVPGLQEASVGAESFVKAMDDARTSSRVKAIVLRIDSPGGFAPAADEMLRAVVRARAEKPVIVSMGSVAASGGYWIATSADSIIAEPLTITGSIGVFSLFFDLSDLMADRIGITFDGVKTGPSADIYSAERTWTDQERRNLERSVDATYASFLDKVAQARGMTVEQVDAIAGGRVWTGADALEVGLVDGLGGLDHAVALAAARVGLEEGTYRVRELPRMPTFVERLNQSMAVRLGGTRVPAALRPVAAALVQAHAIGDGTVQARLPFAILDR